MIDLAMLQKDVYDNTKRLGYNVSKKSTLKKLKEEFREFKQSKKVGWVLPLHIANIECDKDFKRKFDIHLKNKEPDEIPDMFFVMLSYCEENNIDFETLVMNKLRYNNLRG